MKVSLTLFATLLVYVVFGLEPETTVVPLDKDQVKEELNEIISLIPRDNITEIANSHLAHDEGFRAAIYYMQQPEWRAMVDSIRANPKWIAFKEMVSKFGLDIDQLIKCTKTFIENANVGDVDPKANRSLAAFVKDVEGVIPIGQMLVTFGKNKNLQNMLQHIQTDESKAVVVDALNIPEVKKYVQELSDMELNVKEVLTFVFAALGWGNFESA
ncbi:unnamed protein product [Callosobruchus maculatus]|uniref:Protein G12 n=1 Tax=Callosobruchus maculatus TaxID=64391 RepID=A0A653D1U8_CALMS|nr:unnamed protein product [Callosobruchus maculatus]